MSWAIVVGMPRGLSYLVLCLVLVGCGEDIVPKEVNEPCTRTEQCVVGLVCLAGVCLEADDDAGVGGLIAPDGGS